MKCPIDGVELVTAERHGVEIDYCPTCRGVWLDRGELDKIIEQAVPPLTQAEPPREWREPFRGKPKERREPYRGDGAQEWREPYRDDRDKGRKRKRRKSFLEEIFDFD